jgi:hypothetical protein
MTPLDYLNLYSDRRAFVLVSIRPRLFDLECEWEGRGLARWRRLPRFQPPPVNPCMRFSRTRLTDIVHRQACVLCQVIVPESRWTPKRRYQA